VKNKKNSKVKETYIFASCKSWHRHSFDSLCNGTNENWHYVANTSELNHILLITKPRYIFFLHWNWIVSETIWMKYECVCFHMTDVPYGRGGSPLQNLILAGHTLTMLTALKMVEGIDAGPVYLKSPLSLEGSAEDIYIRAGRLSIEIIRKIIELNPIPKKQEGEVITFKRRKPEQSKMPSNGSLRNAYDFIRMLDADGYPAAFVEHGEYRFNFKKARLGNDRVITEVEIYLRDNI
jgi:methionyl-tRNA formyltransferase